MNSTKMAIKWTRIDLQTSVIPIWNPENKGYKIGFEKRCWGQQECPKNGSENFRIYSANSVVPAWYLRTHTEAGCNTLYQLKSLEAEYKPNHQL